MRQKHKAIIIQLMRVGYAVKVGKLVNVSRVVRLLIVPIGATKHNCYPTPLP